MEELMNSALLGQTNISSKNSNDVFNEFNYYLDELYDLLSKEKYDSSKDFVINDKVWDIDLLGDIKTKYPNFMAKYDFYFKSNYNCEFHGNIGLLKFDLVGVPRRLLYELMKLEFINNSSFSNISIKFNRQGLFINIYSNNRLLNITNDSIKNVDDLRPFFENVKAKYSYDESYRYGSEVDDVLLLKTILNNLHTFSLTDSMEFYGTSNDLTLQNKIDLSTDEQMYECMKLLTKYEEDFDEVYENILQAFLFDSEFGKDCIYQSGLKTYLSRLAYLANEYNLFRIFDIIDFMYLKYDLIFNRNIPISCKHGLDLYIDSRSLIYQNHKNLIDKIIQYYSNYCEINDAIDYIFNSSFFYNILGNSGINYYNIIERFDYLISKLLLDNSDMLLYICSSDNCNLLYAVDSILNGWVDLLGLEYAITNSIKDYNKK